VDVYRQQTPPIEKSISDDLQKTSSIKGYAMGSQEGLKALAEEYEKLMLLVDAGKLPAHMLPRYFYYGHKPLHGVWLNDRTYTCLACDSKFEKFAGGHDNLSELTACPNCKEEDEFYDTTNDRIEAWECYSCQHKWNSEDGTTCPSCGDQRDTSGNKVK